MIGLSKIIKFVSRLWESYFEWPRSGNIAVVQKPMHVGNTTILERIIRKRYDKVIFDLDDALMIRQRRKINKICNLADLVIVGNEYLRKKLRLEQGKCIVIPTPVNTSLGRTNPRKTDNMKIIIGWIGTATNYKYVYEIETTIARILEKYPNVEIRFVGGPDRFIFPSLRSERIVFFQWSEEKEQTQLSSFDIGIMPLTDDPWTKGKCSFKLLQYMSVGIPVVASPVGMNNEVIDHGTNGFLAASFNEWEESLSMLIESYSLRMKIGRNGREKVIKSYSLKRCSNKFIKTIKLLDE